VGGEIDLLASRALVAVWPLGDDEYQELMASKAALLATTIRCTWSD